MDDVIVDVLVFIIILFITLVWLIKRGLHACLSAHKTEWNRLWLNYTDGFLRLFFCRYYHRLQYTPIELPTQGPAIVVANHLSGLDPILLFAASRRPLRFLIACEVYESIWFNWLYRAVGCIPVDRTKRPEIGLRAALRALQAGEVIAIFPQGKITLPTEAPRKLKRGSLWLAQQVQCPIYPVRLADIRGMGYVVLSVFLPTRATLVSYPPIDKIDEETLDNLQNLLEARNGVDD